ncbi:alpha-L-arabinofuranosidase C-terminal domain-containing protein [Flavihumibacter sp. UBA7668]|uniref:alpha-L-arabinofuranosidase C-terminal domain-containing protein n=1 Tax=Flavihumibacter sp. UBA7668 TaxID=1946542 RepID=UPI0025BE0391|nr:alpha-L-arabinofuranosidase C-terminal domain-containing protein [Flavihumibacter sp. UBA7668]
MKYLISKIGAGVLSTLLCATVADTFSQSAKVPVQKTLVQIQIPAKKTVIDPMIYGQMLENVNDSMIYGGVTNGKGEENLHITELLKPLDIPVMRWPAGTAMHEYRWKNGIGPKPLRPVSPTFAWKGVENYQFGTDEFLQWCKRINTVPYINLNMGNSIEYGGTLWEALEWIEYVNGDSTTALGKQRAYNGHSKPYNVKYWCIGNENYGPWGRHEKEDDTTYGNRLKIWAGAIKKQHPELSLLGIGRSLKWNKEVLSRNGEYIDFLTQHYYVNSKLKDGVLESPGSTLFAPAKMEKHLSLLGEQLNEINRQLNRTENPIRLSVDEWNNRHAIFNGTEFKFTRQSVRKQFDVAVTAGMLNAFIRQSPAVGMANYIFPVNAHGLIRTVGTDDAYLTPLYYLFKQYRTKMLGSKLDVLVKGPGIRGSEVKGNIAGDANEIKLGEEFLSFVDAAAVLDQKGQIFVTLVNRSHELKQEVEIAIPAGYKAREIWELNHANIYAMNTSENRSEILPKTGILKQKGSKVTVSLLPCAFAMIELVKQP